MKTIKELVSSVEKSYAQGDFDKFVSKIVLPKFKNFSPNAEISFRFPISIIVGPNGGGKSSILHAAWGMQNEYSTSRFWFATPVDPIDDSSEKDDQNRYWYEHYIKSINTVAQCRKMIGNKRHGYWEPTRPAIKDGMTKMPARTPVLAPHMSGSGDRWNQVDRAPHYINSKAESSAFDRFFYYSQLTKLEEKQDYFVKYSGLLKYVIDTDDSDFTYYGVQRVFDIGLIPKHQLEEINLILEKNYASAKYVTHSLFDKNKSISIIFETKDRTYSECFAGSGELSVVNCVRALDQLKQYDLLLLDEPETSLHPGALSRLLQYILRIVEAKKIQVIISTHSLTLVQLLPTEALVVLDQLPEGVVARNNPTKAGAFHRLGHLDQDKINILTEDGLLKCLVEKSVALLPIELRKLIIVSAAEVGASEMLSNQVRAFATSKAKVLMVFDGDQKAVGNEFVADPDSLSKNDRDAVVSRLKALNVSVLGSNESKLIDWMKWSRDRVMFIEQICPEQVLLELINPKSKLLTSKNTTNNAYKDAVKKCMRDMGVDIDAASQKTTFNLKFRELPEESPIRASVKKLATDIEKRCKLLLD